MNSALDTSTLSISSFDSDIPFNNTVNNKYNSNDKIPGVSKDEIRPFYPSNKSINRSINNKISDLTNNFSRSQQLYPPISSYQLFNVNANSSNSNNSNSISSNGNSKNTTVRNTRNTTVRNTRNSPVRNARNSPIRNGKNSPVKNRKNSPIRNTRNSPVGNNKKSLVRNNKNSPIKNTRNSPVRNTKITNKKPILKYYVSKNNNSETDDRINSLLVGNLGTDGDGYLPHRVHINIDKTDGVYDVARQTYKPLDFYSYRERYGTNEMGSNENLQYKSKIPSQRKFNEVTFYERPVDKLELYSDNDVDDLFNE